MTMMTKSRSKRNENLLWVNNLKASCYLISSGSMWNEFSIKRLSTYLTNITFKNLLKIPERRDYLFMENKVRRWIPELEKDEYLIKVERRYKNNIYSITQKLKDEFGMMNLI